MIILSCSALSFDSYLWKNFDPETASHAHIMSILLLVNEKFRQEVPVWGTFYFSNSQHIAPNTPLTTDLVSASFRHVSFARGYFPNFSQSCFQFAVGVDEHDRKDHLHHLSHAFVSVPGRPCCSQICPPVRSTTPMLLYRHFTFSISSRFSFTL